MCYCKAVKKYTDVDNNIINILEIRVRRLTKFTIFPLITGLAALMLSINAQAVEFTTSGFISVVAGTVLGGKEGDYLQNVSGFDCPCFVGDYPNAGVYEGNSWSFAPNSRAGIQVGAQFNEQLGFITQAVGYGANDMKPDLTAMYLSWNINDNLTANFGRQRLPLFYYSDFYDVGYAYPWIRVPQDLYGWPINNYNGASAAYTDDLGDGTYRIQLFGGKEHRHDDVENSKIYWAVESFVQEWNKILGASASYTYDWFDIRVVYMESSVDAEANYGDGSPVFVVNDDEKQKFSGVAFNIDYENFLLVTELNHFEIGAAFASNAKMVGTGYRLGAFTPMLTYTRYDDIDEDLGGRSELRTRSFSVRWDAMKDFDVKLQFDVIRDATRWVSDDTTTPVSYYNNFVGNTRAVSVGVDYVF